LSDALVSQRCAIHTETAIGHCSFAAHGSTADSYKILRVVGRRSWNVMFRPVYTPDVYARLAMRPA
jgi:hypothetical protein